MKTRKLKVLAWTMILGIAVYGMSNAKCENNASSQTETSYIEKLKTYRKLADKNRDEYLPRVAETLYNLSNSQRDKEKYGEVEASYKEALKIYRELADKDREKYLPDVATNLLCLSYLYQKGPNKELSLKYAREALDIPGKCKARNN